MTDQEIQEWFDGVKGKKIKHKDWIPTYYFIPDTLSTIGALKMYGVTPLGDKWLYINDPNDWILLPFPALQTTQPTISNQPSPSILLPSDPIDRFNAIKGKKVTLKGILPEFYCIPQTYDQLTGEVSARLYMKPDDDLIDLHRSYNIYVDWIILDDNTITKEENNSSPKVCTCDIRDLMTYGCRCGAFKKS